ncbi:hypothetical protein [Adhaeribacter radiodurans]|uniref:Uncharacterized protein n=1 Tax=Adhaeribacter radiodurans TaxID=2745197 RepID=A0A7L7LCA6_9BACT|nr:hypothetical protein [Adhaeribacter radiodurans]QMU30478.1 hypothetical protein HUW48_21720 [Adhaeribacter radiodurans]
MIEVRTFSFSLRVEKNNTNNSQCNGNYYLVLSCESPFDTNKSFSEEFLSDSDLTPFYSFGDIARFAEEMATFWKIRLLVNPKLDLTRLEEIADLWSKLLRQLTSELTLKEVA